MTRLIVTHQPEVQSYQHYLDALWVSERRRCDSPLTIDPNACGELFETAGISVEAWKAYLLERYGHDIHDPKRETFARLYPNRTPFAIDLMLQKATEHAAYGWGRTEEEISTSNWTLEDDSTAIIDCERMFEIIDNAQGYGLVTVAFSAEPSALSEALGDDMKITVAPNRDGPVMFGLFDQANGAGYMIELDRPYTFRPSIKGTLSVDLPGTTMLEETFEIQPGVADLTATLGEPLRYSSRSEETMRFGPPKLDRSHLEHALAGQARSNSPSL